MWKEVKYMDISFIIGIVFFIIAAVIIIKMVGTLFKAIMAIFSLLTFAMLIFGLFVYMDANDLKENFADSDKLFLLESNDNIISGFYGVMGEKQTPAFLTEQELEQYNNLYQKNDLQSIQSDKFYKVFIIKKSLFDDIDQGVEMNDVVFTKEDINEILSSDNAVEDIMDLIIAKRELPTDSESLREDMRENFKSDIETKGLLFAALFSEKISDEGPVVLLSELKGKNIMVYPETVVFKLAKTIPISLVEKIVTLQESGVEVGNA